MRYTLLPYCPTINTTLYLLYTLTLYYLTLLYRWYFTEMDIRSTLYNTCIKVLHDHSVSATVRTLRAQALKIVGELFISKGGTLAAGLGDIKSKLHNRMNGSTHSSESEKVAAEADAATSVSNNTTTTATTTTPAVPVVVVPESATEDDSNID